MKNREPLGIAICTFNNHDLVIECLHSLLESDFQEFHIYLVDNASADGTYEAVQKEFKNCEKLSIIRNSENLGCSGGFDTGIKAAYENGHKYIACLDSDIRLKKDAIRILYEYLESDETAAVAGARVMYMDQPDLIQWVGSKVVYGKNFCDVFEEKIEERKALLPSDVLFFGAVFEYQGRKFENQVDKVRECDLLPACAYMFRSCVIEKVGFWDTSYFLYWDETDWQKRVQDAGWKLVCCTDSVIWHKNGSFMPTNTRALYYGARNVVRYYGKYVPEEKLEELTKYILWSNFQMIYPSNYKGLEAVMRTIMLAIDDAVKGISGPVPEGRVFDREVEKTDLLKNALDKSNGILLRMHKKYDDEMAQSIFFDMVIRIMRKKPDTRIVIQYDLPESYRALFADRAVFSDETDEDCDFKMTLCAHVNVDLPEWEEGWCIGDSASNLIDTYEGWIYFKNYKRMWDLFYITHKDTLLSELRVYHKKANQ